MSKWFELEIADYDIFREEVRLWRNISSMIPTSVLEGPTSSTPITLPKLVPPMILDVILDTSSLSERHLLTMDQIDLGGSREKRRVRVDGKDWNTGPSSRKSSTGKSKEEQESDFLDSHRKPIVLESWKLELGVCSPPDPPDLPTLYRHATAHLKELFSLAKQLPAHSMFARLQKSKEATRKGGVGEDSEEDLLKIGIRLGLGKEEEPEQDDEVCSLQEPLGPALRASQSTPHKVTEIFAFQPLLTAVGIMHCSVEYRVDADFFIEDLGVLKNLRDLELDEDYFRPHAAKAQARLPSKTVTSQQQSPLSASPSAQSGTLDKRSLLSATSDRRQSIIASEASSYTGARGGATPSPPGDLVSRSPGTGPATIASVFSATPSSGKPVAGLSSLRRTPSVTGHGSSPTTAMTAIGATGASAASPATSHVLASDAAFLSHGRRTSTSERRLRTLSTLSGSGDRGSPPATAVSVSPSHQSSGRPILARATGSALPSLRSGSYSPSSPSPLAQQLSAHHQNPACLSTCIGRLREELEGAVLIGAATLLGAEAALKPTLLSGLRAKLGELA